MLRRFLFSHAELVDHLHCEDHLELISVLNRSVPAVIKRIHLQQCDLCGRKFRLNIALKKHMIHGHGRGEFELKDHVKYKCGFCDYWSYKQKSLHTHGFLGNLPFLFFKLNIFIHFFLFSVHPRKNLQYKCTFCRKEFSKAEHLKQHRNSVDHIEAVRRFKNVVEVSKHCAVCGEEFAGAQQLKLHMETRHLRNSIYRFKLCFL